MAGLCSHWTKVMDLIHYAESWKFHIGKFCEINDYFYTISPTLLDGQSNRLAGEVWMALSFWQRLDKLCNHHPGDPRFFLDPHCEHWKMKCQ